MAFIGRGINTVRTFGNQYASGIKTFENEIITRDLLTTGTVQVTNINLPNQPPQIYFHTPGIIHGRFGLWHENAGYNAWNSDYTAYYPIFCTGSTAGNSVVTTTALQYGANGCVRFGNGIIIQWGNNAVGTVTFTIPFSSTNYMVAFGQSNASEHNINTTVINKTSTGFQIGRGYESNWIAIGN